MKLFIAAAVLLAFSLSGCLGSDEGQEDGAVTPTPPPPPPPAKTLVASEQASDDVPDRSSPFSAEFAVDEGHNHIFLTFHSSGVGTYRLIVRDPDGMLLHDSEEQTITTQPDSHSHDDAVGVSYEVMPGPGYELELTWTGMVTYHMRVTGFAETLETETHEH